VLNLIPADLDRSIAHINPNIEGANLEHLITECIDTIAPVEHEVRDRQGHWYSLRVRPYRSVENKIEGAVLALFDIDAPKRFEESTRAAERFAEALVEASPEAVAVLDQTLRVKLASDRFARLLASTPDALRERSVHELFEPTPGVEVLRSLVAGDGVPDGQPQPAELLPTEGSRRVVRVRGRALQAYDSPTARVVVVTAEEPRRPRRQQ
jgi:two-component system CheB/CheR fusion protein